jgi:hypothetical protein
MSKSKQFVLAIVILAVGIAFVNTYLFALPQNACWCDSRQEAEMWCGIVCILNGGCMWATPVSAICDDAGNCASVWVYFCDWGTVKGDYFLTPCWDCVNP